MRQCAALASPTHSASRLTDLMLGEVETSESVHRPAVPVTSVAFPLLEVDRSC